MLSFLTLFFAFIVIFQPSFFSVMVFCSSCFLLLPFSATSIFCYFRFLFVLFCFVLFPMISLVCDSFFVISVFCILFSTVSVLSLIFFVIPVFRDFRFLWIMFSTNSVFCDLSYSCFLLFLLSAIYVLLNFSSVTSLLCVLFSVFFFPFSVTLDAISGPISGTFFAFIVLFLSPFSSVTVTHFSLFLHLRLVFLTFTFVY